MNTCSSSNITVYTATVWCTICCNATIKILYWAYDSITVRCVHLICGCEQLTKSYVNRQIVLGNSAAKDWAVNEKSGAVLVPSKVVVRYIYFVMKLNRQDFCYWNKSSNRSIRMNENTENLIHHLHSIINCVLFLLEFIILSTFSSYIYKYLFPHTLSNTKRK